MKTKAGIALMAGALSAAMLTACAAQQLEPSGENSVTAAPGADTVTVMTYNVKNCDLGQQIDAIAADIRAENPDVVCVQEIDQNVERSGSRDVLRELAAAVGMNYEFYPTIELQGGTYGLGILSVYPLESCAMVPLETRRADEDRVLASATINVDGKPIKIYNTHLSFEDTDQRRKQWDFLNETLAGESLPFVLTGDFNVSDISEFSILTGVTAINNAQTQYETFVGEGEDGFRCLDNIFVSDDLTVESHHMGSTSASDHRPLTAVIQL